MKKLLPKNLFAGLTLVTLLTMVSCGQVLKGEEITVMLEGGDYVCSQPVQKKNKGSDFTFSLFVSKDKMISDCSYTNYSLVESNQELNNSYTLTFHAVNYPTVVSLDITDCLNVIYQSEGQSQTIRQNKSHLRYNVLNDYHLFRKEGYSLLGYTHDGRYVGLGNRVDVSKDNTLTASWIKQTETCLFDTEELYSGMLAITGYSGNDQELVIPDTIDGKTVSQINANAFSNQSFNKVVLPYTLKTIQENSFTNCQIDELYFYDGLSDVNDASFAATTIKTVYLNAIKDPVYSGTYFDTYPDKMDRLISLKDKAKIILYSGSSTRFGYQSQLIDEAFSDYDVINMGVYAYTNSLPQLDILSNYVKAKDILITSPEFDTLDTQVNLTNRIDYALFSMCESNYNLLSLLDLRNYTGFFDAYQEYQSYRKDITPKGYQYSVNSFDEDGNSTTSSTYNRYGDYALYRENNLERKNFGIKRAYYNKNYFPLEGLASFNEGYQILKDKKVSVYYDYSPRMNNSISSDSNEDTIKELGTYLESNITLPFLNTIQDSLWDPLYFYGTDNHLSTEGAKIRSEKVIQSLKNQTEYL